MADAAAPNQDELKAALTAVINSLPPTYTLQSYLTIANLTDADIVSLASIAVAPHKIDFCILPEEITRVVGNDSSALRFKDKKLRVGQTEKILIACYARDHGFAYAIKASDGYLLARPAQVSGDYIGTCDRFIKIDSGTQAVKAAVLVGKVLTKRNMTGLLSLASTDRLAKTISMCRQLPKEGFKSLETHLKQLANKAELSIGDIIDKITTTDESLKGFSKDLYLQVLQACLVQTPLTEVFDAVQDLEVETAMSVLASHPEMALPYLKPDKKIIVESNCEIAKPTLISELGDETEVLCTKSYVTLHGLKAVRNDVAVFTNKIYLTVPKKKAKRPEREEDPIKGVFLPSKIIKWIAQKNLGIAVKRAKTAAADAEGLELMPDDE